MKSSRRFGRPKSGPKEAIGIIETSQASKKDFDEIMAFINQEKEALLIQECCNVFNTSLNLPEVVEAVLESECASKRPQQFGHTPCNHH